MSTQGHILIVDDDHLNRITLSVNLEAAGYTVTLAENGQKGLDLMRQEAFDTVLLDLMMPVMDGFEVLQEVRADATLQHLPVIVISADDDIESVVRCIEMGAADHLSKPFNPVVLRARISACVGKKRSHDREVALFAELGERYRQLQELQKLRDDLTHMIVHDLRTPLTALLSGLLSIPILGELTPEQDECLAMATDGGHGLLNLINELLDISKMEAGSLKLERVPLNAVDLLERARLQVAQLATERGIHLTLAPDLELPRVLGEEEKLVRVLVNLAGNAIKFTPADGQVTLRAYSSPGGVTFSVTDTGEGIPREEFERIFQKFGQVENRQSGRKMSTGLGLTFCKMIVEALGGRIWVESELGRGSVFSFELPAAT